MATNQGSVGMKFIGSVHGSILLFVSNQKLMKAIHEAEIAGVTFPDLLFVDTTVHALGDMVKKLVAVDAVVGEAVSTPVSDTAVTVPCTADLNTDEAFFLFFEKSPDFLTGKIPWKPEDHIRKYGWR